MPGDLSRERDTLVRSLAAMMKQGEAGLSHVPKLVTQIIKTDAWRERVTALGHPAAFAHFEQFVTTAPLAGLGVSMGFLRDMCRIDAVALDALDQVMQGRQGQRTDLGNNVPEVEGRPEGNTRAKALRRLRAHRPDLHARVLAGELSAHRAMVDAGFRREKTVLDQLQHFWDKATPEVRAAFLRANHLVEDVTGQPVRTTSDTTRGTR